MAKKTNYSGLKQLGAKSAVPAEPDVKTLERVPNPHPGENYLVRFTAPEFTCAMAASALVVLALSGSHVVRTPTGVVPLPSPLGVQLLSISPGCTIVSPTDA